MDFYSRVTKLTFYLQTSIHWQALCILLSVLGAAVGEDREAVDLVLMRAVPLEHLVVCCITMIASVIEGGYIGPSVGPMCPRSIHPLSVHGTETTRPAARKRRITLG